MNAPRITMLLALALGLFANACATSQPSPMLVEAREDYDDARTGMAGKYAPDLVYEAKKSLDAAERAHSRDPGSAEEEHLAYLAQRRTMLAVSAAEQQKAHQDSQKAEKAFETVLVSQRDEAQNKYAKVGDQLADEREKRKAAEDAARRAMASLNEIASVKAEETRTVITLSGEVLFKTNEATLLPIAQTQLDKVAEALKSQGEDKKIVIEGHTDSRGKDDFNQGLSQRRAEAVRSYLVSRGLDADMVQALGKGELEPVADNKTAEGRANNRRVEIEIENSGSSDKTPMKSK
jgi:outer membrane protein OmpA-like peptidoglycan-associated protein